MVVGHVAAFGHGRRDLDRIAQYKHVFRRSGLEGLVIDAAPAVVGHVVQPGLHGDGAGAHGRQRVDDVGLDVVLHVELDDTGPRVHRRGLVLPTVFNDALVLLGPDFLEQRPLGGDIRVGVQDQHLAARLGGLEVAGDDRRAFVRAGRAAVRRLGNGDGVDAAVGHGFELPAQRHGLGAGLPGLQDLAGGLRLLQSFDAAVHQVHTGGHHELVIGNGRAAAQGHGFLRGIDGAGHVPDHGDAMVPGQSGVSRGDVTDLLAAAQHQVGNRAGDKRGLRLDQNHVDFVVRQQAHIFGGGCAAVTTANHHHPGLGGNGGGGTGAQAKQAQGSGGLEKGTSLHGCSPYFFWAAK